MFEQFSRSPLIHRRAPRQDETSVNTNESAGHLTNMTTRKQIETRFAGYLHDDILVGIRMLAVVSDEDYALLAEDLSDEWRVQNHGK